MKKLLSLVVFLGCFVGSVFAATVNVPVANIYKRPANNSDVISQAIYGTKITVLHRMKKPWLHIQTADKYVGWMKAKAVVRGRKWPHDHIVMVNNLFANIYQDPSISMHKPIFTLPFSTRLPLLKTINPKWLQIGLVNGKTAYVQSGDVVIDPKPLSIDEMVSLSHKFLGIPYTWGGVSSYGIDCSGFAQMLYKQMGVLLPRDTALQAASPLLQKVNRDDLSPGDLIYFGWNNKISHVGLYLGDNKFIDATTYKKPIVQISDLKNRHWQDIYITARRLRTHSKLAFVAKASPIPPQVAREMKKYTWHKGCPVDLEYLSYLKLTYWGFDNKPHQGVLIVNRYLAPEITTIFKKLYQQRFPIQRMRPMYLYHGDDNLAMEHNNTSAFNCRAMTDYPNQFSIHSYGGAIDINTLINPYVNKGKVLPAGGKKYLNRKVYQKGMIMTDGNVVSDFTKYGWKWGGSWPNFKDYQHFEKPLPH